MRTQHHRPLPAAAAAHSYGTSGQPASAGALRSAAPPTPAQTPPSPALPAHLQRNKHTRDSVSRLNSASFSSLGSCWYCEQGGRLSGLTHAQVLILWGSHLHSYWSLSLCTSRLWCCGAVSVCAFCTCDITLLLNMKRLQIYPLITFLMWLKIMQGTAVT